jgi:RND family efflux transporter MFP subunit
MNKTVFFACPLALMLWGCQPADQAPAPEQGVKVRTMMIDNAPEASANYIGTIEESVSTPLNFSVTGTVGAVYVSEGASVRKGQLLAVLSNANLQQALQMAQATEKRAQDAYDRLSEIYRKGSLPAIKFVEVETALEQARAATEIARKNLGDCRLYAPASGVISHRAIEPGSNFIPGATAFTLVDIRKVYVRTPVPEKEIGTIRSGQKATITVTALNDREFRGTTEEIGVIANPVSHTYAVKIAVDNPQMLLRPGMVCRVTLEEPSQAAGIVVPLDVVQVDGQGHKSVFVRDSSGRALQKPVTTGGLSGNGVIITQGLSRGDELIVEGYQKISNGTLVVTEQ